MTILLKKQTRQLFLLITVITLLLSACSPQTAIPTATPHLEEATAEPEPEAVEDSAPEVTTEKTAEAQEDVASPTVTRVSPTAAATVNGGEFELDPAYSAKFSPMTKFNLMEGGLEQTAELNLLIRTDGEPTARQLAQLEDSGAIVRTVAGDVLTVTATAEQLNAVAAFDFVISIDISMPLYPEGSEEDPD